MALRRGVRARMTLGARLLAGQPEQREDDRGEQQLAVFLDHLPGAPAEDRRNQVAWARSPSLDRYRLPFRRLGGLFGGSLARNRLHDRLHGGDSFWLPDFHRWIIGPGLSSTAPKWYGLEVLRRLEVRGVPGARSMRLTTRLSAGTCPAAPISEEVVDGL